MSRFISYLNSCNCRLPSSKEKQKESEEKKETKLVCKYNVTSTSEPTALRTNYEQNIFKSMEIDGVMLDELVTEYTFDTIGVHTVKYELYDKTKLGNSAPPFYNGNLIEITIPDSVTTIGSNAFNGCTALTSINISNSVTSIGSQVFANCTGLKTLNYNAQVGIGEGAFAGKPNLTNVTIGNNVTSIGEGAFNGCTALTSCTFEENSQLTSIGGGAFYNCSSLTSINISSGVTSIGDNAFSYCNGLTSVSIDSNTIVSSVYTSSTNMKNIFGPQVEEYIIGNSVTSIGDNAFYYCTSLTSVTIGSGVTSIGDYAFASCSDLTSCTFNENSQLTSIGYAAFASCDSLTSIDIPNSVTSIGNSVFNGCSSLTSIDIPNSVTSIGTNVFNGCSGLMSMTVDSSNTTYDSRNNCNAIIKTSTNELLFGCKNTVIPNSVISISNSAFLGCSSLTNIEIPNGVTSIGYSVFQWCRGLESVTVNVTTPPALGQIAFDNNASGRKIYVPAESVEAYKTAENWSTYADSIFPIE